MQTGLANALSYPPVLRWGISKKTNVVARRWDWRGSVVWEVRDSRDSGWKVSLGDPRPGRIQFPLGRPHPWGAGRSEPPQAEQTTARAWLGRNVAFTFHRLGNHNASPADSFSYTECDVPIRAGHLPPYSQGAWPEGFGMETPAFAVARLVDRRERRVDGQPWSCDGPRF